MQAANLHITASDTAPSGQLYRTPHGFGHRQHFAMSRLLLPEVSHLSLEFALHLRFMLPSERGTALILTTSLGLVATFRLPFTEQRAATPMSRDMGLVPKYCYCFRSRRVSTRLHTMHSCQSRSDDSQSRIIRTTEVAIRPVHLYRSPGSWLEPKAVSPLWFH